MAEMTSQERFTRTIQHKEPDRVPMWDDLWGSTLARWHREGLPQDIPWQEYFGLDHLAMLHFDGSPRFPEAVLEETEDYVLRMTEWGATVKNFRHIPNMTEFVSYTLKGPDNWPEYKARITPSRDRIDWNAWDRDYKRFRANGSFIVVHAWFGFDLTHHAILGTTQMLMEMGLHPEWCKEVFDHLLEVSIQQLDMLWDAGYHFDAVKWADDMGYKNGTFFSLQMYRDLLKPAQQRFIEWAHSKGIFALLHSCGNVKALLPDLMDMGLDCLNPLEVKAGMDPYALKAEVGQRLCLHGGFNAMLWKDVEKLEAEMRRLLPAMKGGGGYIFASDHSIPDDVSLQNMRKVVEIYKELAVY